MIILREKVSLYFTVKYKYTYVIILCRILLIINYLLILSYQFFNHPTWLSPQLLNV